MAPMITTWRNSVLSSIKKLPLIAFLSLILLPFFSDPIQGQTMCTQIMVDQFGYRQYAKKVVVFADPQAARITGPRTRARVPGFW